MDLSQYWAKHDKTIQEHNNELLYLLKTLKNLNYINDEHIYQLTKKACELHDLGKVNPEFQKRVRLGEKKLKFNPIIEVAHNVLSLYFIDEKDFQSQEDYLKVAYAVLNSHNYCDAFEVIRSKKDLISHLLESFDTVNVKRSVTNKISCIIEKKDSILIKGFLHKCDYCASAGIVAEYPNDFLENGLSGLIENWKIDNENAEWNDLQKFCMQHTDDNIIVVAQTGMGKTEGGLHWIGHNKGFFILPIRTAINAIYDRIRVDILKNKDIDTRLAILHSSSLNYYYNIIYDEEIDLIEYENRGKKLSIPLNISTMDQLFDFVYKYHSYELKLTTLSYSKIVIDEIQMYSPDLLAFLIYGLKMVNEMGGKIAIITATFPPFIRGLLKPIPFKEGIFLNELKRHNIKVIKDKIDSEDIYLKYLNNKNANVSNKILVVCNTVKKAQTIYCELKNLMKNDFKDLHLLHNKFIKFERLEKEKEIVNFGKTFDENHNINIATGIWITTSLVEASLDIDFDYLFTELMDLNSLFQRFGRCNRKGVKDCSVTNCFVYTEIEKNTIRIGNRGFIDQKMYELSKTAISGIEGIITEKDKVWLINEYFTNDKLMDSDYLREYYNVYDFIKCVTPNELDKCESILRNIVTKDIIPSPVYEKYKDDINYYLGRLNDVNIGLIERVNFKNEIMKFTVSVYPYEANKKKMYYCESIYLSKFEKIPIITCYYDEQGFKAM